MKTHSIFPPPSVSFSLSTIILAQTWWFVNLTRILSSLLFISLSSSCSCLRSHSICYFLIRTNFVSDDYRYVETLLNKCYDKLMLFLSRHTQQIHLRLLNFRISNDDSKKEKREWKKTSLTFLHAWQNINTRTHTHALERRYMFDFTHHSMSL